MKRLIQIHGRFLSILKNFSLPTETSQTDAAKGDANTTVKLSYEVAGQFSKKEVVSEKVLPNTGSEQSIFLLFNGNGCRVSRYLCKSKITAKIS